MALNGYISQVQQLVHDTAGSFYPVSLITGWINQARQRVAEDGQCIRVLPPNSAGVASVTIANGGTGYTSAPTVTFSGPALINGVTAQGTATISGGSVAGVIVTTAGSGYNMPPGITFSGGGGSGARATAVLGSGNFTVANQEVYSFATANAFVQQTAGVSGILSLKQVAVYWGNIKPPLNYCPWTLFNAKYRSWPLVSNFPSVWSQYGQGENGTLYFWPIPSSVLGMDWDCICVPLALGSDSDPEAIPSPFTDAVQYYATYLAFLYGQRKQDAQLMMQMYQQRIRAARANSMRSLVTDYYNGLGC